MDIKTIFGFGNSATPINPQRRAMQDRISTPEGCRKLANELQHWIDKLEPNSSVRRLLRDQLQEVNRLLQALEVQMDRDRAAAVIKRDQGEASKALKTAETSLKKASESWAEIERKRLECQGEIDRLSQELAKVFDEADKGVIEADTAFRDVMGGAKQGSEAEAKAFEVLRKAKTHRQTCGEFWEHRISLRQDQLRTIEAELAQSADRKSEAQDAADQANTMLVAIEYDRALQQLIDAAAQIRAVSSSISSAKPKDYFVNRAMDLPHLSVVSAERIVNGAQFVDAQRHVPGGRVVQLLGNLEKPADLDLLTRLVTPEGGLVAVEEPDELDSAHVDQSATEA